MAQSSVLSPSGSSTSYDSNPIGETGAVVGHLAHELCQPLSTLEASAYYLKLILAGKDARVDLQLDKIQQLVQSMSWILADAVHYLQPSAPRPQGVDLTDFVTEALANQDSPQHVEMDWSGSGDAPLVNMDPGQAQHMVRVLLSAFRQIADSNRSIQLSFYRTTGNVVFQCSTNASDTLCDRCEDLLLPFTPHLSAGAGLALASVQRIVEAHGGRVVVKASNGVLALEMVLPAH